MISAPRTCEAPCHGTLSQLSGDLGSSGSGQLNPGAGGGLLPPAHPLAAADSKRHRDGAAVVGMKLLGRDIWMTFERKTSRVEMGCKDFDE